MENTEVEIPHGMRNSNREKSFLALALIINSIVKVMNHDTFYVSIIYTKLCLCTWLKSKTIICNE